MSVGGGGGSEKVEETPEEKELAQIASERWERYKETFKPLENQYMAEVDDLGTQQAQDQVTGQAVSGVQQGVGDMAIDPNQGNPMGNTGAALGSARANAATQATTGLRGQHIQGMQGIVQMGQGQSADAIQGMSDIAGQAASEAAADAKRETFRDFNRRQAWGNLAGNVAGAGMAYGMQGGNGMQTAKRGLAQQNQGDPMFQSATRDAYYSNPNMRWGS